MSAMDKRVDPLTRRKFLPAAAQSRSSRLMHLPRRENCSLPSPIHPPNSADRPSSAFPLLRRSYFHPGRSKIPYAKVSFSRRGVCAINKKSPFLSGADEVVGKFQPKNKERYATFY